MVPGFDINFKTSTGSALHDACVGGKTEVAKILLQHHINLDITDQYGQVGESDHYGATQSHFSDGEAAVEDGQHAQDACYSAPARCLRRHAVCPTLHQRIHRQHEHDGCGQHIHDIHAIHARVGCCAEVG